MSRIELCPPPLDSRDPRGQCSVGLSLTEDLLFINRYEYDSNSTSYLYSSMHVDIPLYFVQLSYVVSLPRTYDEIPLRIANETFATPWHRRYAD